MSWNYNPPQQTLPFPTDYVVNGAWINSPMNNPPQCPLKAPGAAEGIERNILGAMLEYLQSQSSVSPIRCFTYNSLSYREYSNQEFTDLLNTILILTAALLETGQFQRGSQAAEFAVARMVDYQYVRMAKQYPALQDLDPQMGAVAGEIEQIGSELGRLVTGYIQKMQQPQTQPAPQWGSQAQAPMSQTGRFSGQREQNPWGNKASPPPATQTQINTDIFSSVKPRQAPNESSIRSTPPVTTSLLDLYSVSTPQAEPQPQETPARPTRPVVAEHPTGNTVHVQETPAEKPRWVVNSDSTPPLYMKPSPSPEGRQNLLYDRTSHKPAYCIEGNTIKASITEREEPMTAGYELHELTFRNKNDGLFLSGTHKPIGEVYNRGRLLKATDEEVGEIIPYYQEKHSGGKLDDSALFSLAAMRKVIDEDDAVLVMLYTETRTIKTHDNLKVLLDDLREAEDLRHAVTALKSIDSTNAYLGQWLHNNLRDLTNQILAEDYGLEDITIDSFVGDVLDLDGIVDDEITQELVDALKARIQTRIGVLIGSVGYLEGNDDEWGVCTLTHHHRIVDVPMTVEQLELSGDQPIGRITRTTAPVLYRLIDGALGETPDHCYWMRTLDGSILELIPAPGGSGHWIIAAREHLGSC